MHTQSVIELDDQSLADVTGGDGILVGILIGVAVGFVANYIYESVGGKAGVDAAVSDVFTLDSEIEVQAMQGLANL